MYIKSAALAAVIALSGSGTTDAFGVGRTQLSSTFVHQSASRSVSTSSFGVAHTRSAGDIAMRPTSQRRAASASASLSMLLDSNSGIEELEEMAKEGDKLTATAQKSPGLFKAGGMASVPAAAALGFAITPAGPAVSAAVAAAGAVGGFIGKSKLDSATEAAARPALAKAVAECGVDSPDLPSRVAAVKSEYNVDDEDFADMCAAVYKRYLIGVVKNPIAKTGEVKELKQLRAGLGMDNLSTGAAHADAAREFYRQTCLFTPEEELEDPDHPDRMSIDKFLFLSERAFRQAGETEEAFKYEMSRVAKAFKVDMEEALERVAEVAEPFYRRALASTRSKLETGAVSSDMLVRARASLGIDEQTAYDMHVTTFNDEIKELLGKDAEMELDPATLKFPENAMARLDKLKEVFGLSDTDADYEIQVEATELFQATALKTMEDTINGIIEPKKAWEDLAQRQNELCLKDEQMKTLLASMVMQSLGKLLEETITFANVNNEAAVYDKLVDTLDAAEKCKLVLSESGWNDFDDFNAKFFDPWSGDSACGFISPEKRLNLFKIFLVRAARKSESGKELTDENYAKVMEVKEMLGVSGNDCNEEIRKSFGPELMKALRTAVDEITGEDCTEDLVKNMKEMVDKVIKDYKLSEDLVREYAGPLYVKACNIVSQATPGGVPNKERMDSLDSLRDLLKLTEEDTFPAHLEVFGEVYKQSVQETMGPTGIIRPEFRGPLEDLQGRLGVSKEAAKDLFLEAVKERFIPMVEFLVLELERSMLTKQQLSQKRGVDYGEDLFQTGKAADGQLGISSETNLMTDIMNVIDFYTENAVSEEVEVGKEKIEKKVMEGDEEKTVEEEVPVMETVYPITALETGAVEEELAELLFRQFVVGAFTAQGPNAARYEASKDTFGGIIGLTKEKQDEISGNIGETVYDNYIQNSMSTKGQLDQQDMMFLANIQGKLGLNEEQGEKMLLASQKKVLSQEADSILNMEGAQPEIVKTFREKCNSMGMELEKDVGISKQRLVRMFEMEITPQLNRGEITINNADLLTEVQESLGLTEEEAEKVFENIVDKRAKVYIGQVKGEILRGREDNCAEAIKKIVSLAQFVDGELGLEVEEATAYKIFNLYEAIDFSDEEKEDVEANKDLLKVALGLAAAPVEA